jgi:NTE family protein
MTNSIESDSNNIETFIEYNKTNQQKEDKENNLVAYAGPEQIVYEGSTVLLEGHGNHENQKLIWRQIGGGPLVNLEYENKQSANEKIQNPSFKAPYITLDIPDDDDDVDGESNTHSNNNLKPYTKLTFELIVKDMPETLSSPPSTVNIIIKMVQRALVFQGGGSLGAYEAGVFSALCDRLIKEDDKAEGRKNRPVFDIIAGSSIGAVNAAIIVGNIKKIIKDNTSKNANQRLDCEYMWKEASNQLNRFWDDISYSTWWLDTNLFKMWWDGMNNITKTYIQNYKSFIKDNEQLFGWKHHLPLSQFHFYMPENLSPMASGEAARRYFSWIHFLYLGVPKVMSPNFSQPDSKFLLGVPSFARFDNTPLTKTIREYWDYDKYPIKTEFEKGEPRLLLVCVDVMDAASAVTFDSYKCETKYSDGKSTESIAAGATNIAHNNFNYVIKYPDGISIEHISASMSPHLKYQYPSFQAYSERENKNIDRYFWDGAYLSNTPLRELIQAHREFWYEEDNEDKKHVPHLEVYIVNLYPTVKQENELPSDADTIQDREVDIRFHDRTQYDVRVAQLISDYVILHGQVKNLAITHLEKSGQNKSDAFLEDLKNLLDIKIPKSTKHGAITKKNMNHSEDNYDNHNTKFTSERKYKDIIEGRFDIANVIYIDRKDDGNTIFGKAAEFSTKTINKLREDGRLEALNELKNIYG